MKFIKESIPYLIIVLVVLLIRTFIATPVIVQGTSMVPTLDGGELMILEKFDLNYKRFDIVVVSSSVEGKNLIKRVIGLPGETIRYYNGQLFINDSLVNDTYGYGTTSDFEAVTLDEDEYFLMGDNREISLDSRSLGVIKKSEIDGKANLVLFPFKKIGVVK